MSWNIQGAGSKEVHGAFKELKNRFQPDVVAILEPRITGGKADYFVKRSRFDRSFRIEADGFFGGIWLLCKEDVRVTILKCHEQFIHTRIMKGSVELLVTFVYANPNPTLRRPLWDMLSKLGDSICEPWLIGGDMNCTLHESERKGGSRKHGGRCKLFVDWVLQCGLHDLNMSGPKYTWLNGRGLHKKLDRFLANDEWINRFQHGFVENLPRWQYDHHPILARCKGNQTPPTADAVRHFCTRAKEWNHTTFGNIYNRKRRALARLAGVIKSRENYSNLKLQRLEVELLAELDEIVQQEELLLIQKSNRDWTLHGDKNTKWYHSYVKSCRRRNRVISLKADDRRMVYDQEEMRSMAENFLKNLYVGPPTPQSIYTLRNCFPAIPRPTSEELTLKRPMT
ncbi:OLC1v1004004C1 [Oldenlandia corymbosa var. corymbosa]|uniref:OLC1v1004004C1 n=1 Tax=Oldenlandia corymbosa var. corymbosa TaxID=529605 RepID=A0AAV1DB84_OLDCO|nr:OLC1v1004004C1 [Oldenlandia corymbosa var. corymbosa]